MGQSIPLLKGSTALVTGAARGIGLAVSKAFAIHGAKVILADLNKTQVVAASKNIANSLAEELDVVDETQTELLFDTLENIMSFYLHEVNFKNQTIQ